MIGLKGKMVSQSFKIRQRQYRREKSQYFSNRVPEGYKKIITKVKAKQSIARPFCT